MIQDIAPKKFHIEYQEKTPAGSETALVYSHNLTLLKTDESGRISFPKVSDFQDTGTTFTYLFRIDGEEYYLGKIPEVEVCGDLLEMGYRFEKDRIFRAAEPRDLAFAGITGKQLAEWYRSHRFCGVCGHEMAADHKERMMRCPSCGKMYYPTICPAVIVAVMHKGRLLMSKYAGREYTRFALLAGFAESGESIEETVHREIMEEVGLKVKNLRFYKSQPWPFTDTLLMGFFCELDGEDDGITLDEEELSMAGWYGPEEIPEDTEHASLTSEMMTLFRSCGGDRDRILEVLNRPGRK